MSAVHKPQRSKGVLVSLLKQYGIRTTISQSMTRKQLDAMYTELSSNSVLGSAMKAMIVERNATAKKNSSLGSEKSRLASQRDAARETVSYLERQLEIQAKKFNAALKAFLSVEHSEIYQVIRHYLQGA